MKKYNISHENNYKFYIMRKKVKFIYKKLSKYSIMCLDNFYFGRKNERAKNSIKKCKIIRTKRHI